MSLRTQLLQKAFPQKEESIELDTVGQTSSSHSEEPIAEKPSHLHSAKAVFRKLMGKSILQSKGGRTIPVCVNNEPLVDARTNKIYGGNSITSARYTIWSFLPRQLYAQFSKVANCYFMVVAIMQMIPSWSTTGTYTTIIPLLIFISISIMREGYDDWRRHLLDKEENNRDAKVLEKSKVYALGNVSDSSMTHLQDREDPGEDVSTDHISLSVHNLFVKRSQWKRIRVGHVVRIDENDWVPADCILLSAKSESGEAYVETMALDGETNLKPKTVHPELFKYCKTSSGLASLDSMSISVTSEDPNMDLYNYEGTLNVGLQKYALGPENILYRGSILRNSTGVLALVVFSGEETKIRMNAIKNPRTKAPKLQKAINWIVVFMVCVVILLSAFSTMAQRLLLGENRSRAWYLRQEDAGVAATLMGFIIMYNTLIPLSLYVTMEIIKVVQLLLLQWDIDMYHSATDTPAAARTATILEELGQVGYVFSDKTGTLTENKMLFQAASVCGEAYYMQGPAEDKKMHQMVQQVHMHPDTPWAKRCHMFLLSLSLCHSCIPRYKGIEVEYQASSPDELALVVAAQELGYILYKRERNTVVIKTYPDRSTPFEQEYEILETVEFTSSRKRMSVVVRFPDGRICLLCKGADNVIMDLLEESELAREKARELNVESKKRKAAEAQAVIRNSVSSNRRSSLDYRPSAEIVDGIAKTARKSLHLQQRKKYGDQSLSSEFLFERTLEHVEQFSTEGLRTLVYAHRWLDPACFAEWREQYSCAKTALSNRSAEIERVGAQLEVNLQLDGATAIEDKLQLGVPDTVERLRRAGIKMWMLTGDKRETAINIGISCKLIHDYSKVVILSSDDGIENVGTVMAAAELELKSHSVAHCVVVVDGQTLSELEADATLWSLFLSLGVVADSVICCRASPAQKASVVSGVRSANPSNVTLSIGDGANDIAMIQSADIGIGITGKEGLQAARSADYSIAQFRFLVKLLLVHGRYNYVRTSKFVMCTFYKELLFYLSQTLYQRHTLFTGSSLYEPWSLSMFNTLFTSLPVLCVGMFEKDLHPATLIAVPELYSKGRLCEAFNLKVFVVWMVVAASQSVMISFVSWSSYGFPSSNDNSTYALCVLMFATLVIVINTKCQVIEMRFRTKMCFAAWMTSCGGYMVWCCLLVALYKDNEKIFYVQHGFFEHFGLDYTWWASLLLLIVIAEIVDVVWQTLYVEFWPSDSDLFQEIENSVDMRRRFENDAFPYMEQSWTWPHESHIIESDLENMPQPKQWMHKFRSLVKKGSTKPATRKRAETLPTSTELPPGSDSVPYVVSSHEVLPSGKVVKRQEGRFDDIEESDREIEMVIERRLNNL